MSTRINNFLRIAGLSALLLFAAASQLGAETYASYTSGFYFTYPDSWVKVPYNTVDEYLARSRAGRPLYNYEAAFAPDSSNPFFANQYLIVFVDTVGQLSDKQIDSVLNQWSNTFGKGIKYFPVGDFLANVKSNEPTYDKDRKLITVVNDIVSNDKVVKKNLIMTKFYDRGIVSFYFYAPAASFDADKVVFQKIIDSFGSGDISKALPKETVKVANIKTDKEGRPEAPSTGVPNYVPYLGLVILVILLVIIIARKKNKQGK